VPAWPRQNRQTAPPSAGPAASLADSSAVLMRPIGIHVPAGDRPPPPAGVSACLTPSERTS
jgi:hypothetical protein